MCQTHGIPLYTDIASFCGTVRCAVCLCVAVRRAVVMLTVCTPTDFLQTLADLPTTYFYTLRHVIEHLRRVAHEPANSMSSDNLARVFGPTLLRSPEVLRIHGWHTLVLWVPTNCCDPSKTIGIWVTDF